MYFLRRELGAELNISVGVDVDIPFKIDQTLLFSYRKLLNKQVMARGNLCRNLAQHPFLHYLSSPLATHQKPANPQTLVASGSLAGAAIDHGRARADTVHQRRPSDGGRGTAPGR
jgi:hypothetical protein